ncbi:hypothetical protein [Qipengyuania sp. ASV99]|uniref:hypothetical protein n=1 Tax=Qipengyuania sp. ASV99 TaxID=3399681 RepID=UPI003A4C5B3D
MPRYFRVIFAGLACTAFHQTAQAETERVTVTASIPESCRLDASDLVIAEGQPSAQGFAWEACNSRRSYQIAATTRALDPTELVMIDYDSRSLQLSALGRTELINRTGPILKRVPIALRADGLKGVLRLSVSMTAI